MSLLVKFLRNHPNKYCFNINVISQNLHQENVQEGIPEQEFKPLNLKYVRRQMPTKRKFKKAEVPAPRSLQMPVDQDWGNVWPGPKTFHPATVPLPVHQGFVEKGAAPGKFANAELMKIPNFLHLTPPVIKRQCEALKKFCTPWPKELKTDEDCEKYFPLQVIRSTYCHSSPSIRDPLSRIVSIKIKLSELQFDKHAKDKCLRLIGDRYDQTTDMITIVTDRCPTSKQNFEYAMYLLTAVYFESWKFESWEKTKSESDMEYYDWDTSVSCKNIDELFKWNKLEKDTQIIQSYKDSINNLWNLGEDDHLLSQYNNIVRNMLNVPIY